MNMSRAKSHGRTIVRKPVPPIIKEDAENERTVITAHRRTMRDPIHEMANDLAGDFFYFRNWYYPSGRSAFPHSPHMWCVDRAYPQAKGGLLLLDQPNTPEEEKECQKKSVFLRENGYRYLVMKKDRTYEELATELEIMTNGMDNSKQ